MSLPKFYAPVRIKFWSLRMGLGAGYGIIFDVDTQVEHVCRRIKCSPSGWQWQIVNYAKLADGYFGEFATDKEILDMHGSDIEFEIVLKPFHASAQAVQTTVSG